MKPLARTKGKGLTRALRLDLPPETYEKLKKLAAQANMPLRQYVEKAVSYGVGEGK